MKFLSNPVTMKEHELKIVYEELKSLGWNRTRAAKKLDMCIRTLRLRIRELKKQGIAIPDCERTSYQNRRREDLSYWARERKITQYE